MKRKRLFLVASIALLLASCQNELPIDLVQPDITPIVEQQEEFVPSDGMIQLGKKLENPYSLENMRKALELLPAESRSGFSAEDIQPTHLYVKFKPKNVDELDAMLWSDSSLDFYDHPLDYEQVSGGRYYHNPSLPEGVPTYYYVSIPVGHPIPEVCEYEILEELYIPDELTDYTRSLSPAFINAIVKKSFEITGNEYECDAVATRSDGVTRASYTYSGTIRAWDDLMNTYIAVPGALIKCTRWFTTVKAVTNTEGKYSMTRESQNQYNYNIYWERDNQYDIRDGEYDQAKTEGPKQTAGWSLDIGSSLPKDLNFATITRAAYRYFYGNTGGLNHATPMDTGDLKICYMHEVPEDGIYGYFDNSISFEITGDIFIYGKYSSGELLSSNLIFTAASHEMGHSTQCAAMTRSDYIKVDRFLRESWASFVQSLLFYIEYGELGLYNMNSLSYGTFCYQYRYKNILQNIIIWPLGDEEIIYSSYFIDLYDNYNQCISIRSDLYDDVVSGYSASVLNAMVNSCYNLEDTRVYLKANKPSGVTDGMIDSMVNYYITEYTNN